MKLTVTVKLEPDAAQRAALVATLAVCNAEANRVARIAFAHQDIHGQIEREYALRGRVYSSLKATGMGAQLAQHVVKKVCHAYNTVQAQIRGGILRRKRTSTTTGKPVRFRPSATQP